MSPLSERGEQPLAIEKVYSRRTRPCDRSCLPDDTAKHLKRKVDAYLQGGSKSVWVVFPDAKSVEVYSGDSMREFKADQNPSKIRCCQASPLPSHRSSI